MINSCIAVLEKNWKGSFTIPSPRLYPFQWNWDSGFIALGNVHINPERAITEMETLFTGQWANGFLPHIIFHNAEKYKSYFPSADYWNSSVSKFAPKDLKTSGITQPAVHGFVLETLLNKGVDSKRIEILVEKCLKYHNYLYEQREHNNSGLVAIWHNWESGMDNSPWWDSILERIDENILSGIKLNRKDTKEVAESDSTRPKDLDYKRYIYLVDQLRGNSYTKVPSDYPFQILDPVFNSILIKSNRSLIALGKKFGKDTTLIENKTNTALENFDAFLWNEENSLYFPFDILTSTQTKVHCSGAYIPIFAQIPSDKKVTKIMETWSSLNGIIPFPSCFPNELKFEGKNYWRGPVWVNMNWMIWKGLIAYGKVNLANQVKNETIAMVKKNGIYEYFDPFMESQNLTGLGGEDFSWTAALIIDMIKN